MDNHPKRPRDPNQIANKVGARAQVRALVVSCLPPPAKAGPVLCLLIAGLTAAF
jgi:hypothetical protein